MKTTSIFSILFVICLFSGHSYAQNWDQIVKACATDRNTQDYYGRSVAIDGDFAIVGAWGQDKDASGGSASILEAGAAYILQNINDSWIQVQKIVASDRGAEDYFGYSVDISGDYAVVGAWKEDHDADGANAKQDAGSAYIFHNNAGTWEQHQKIVASDRDIEDYFGQSVAIDGDFIVVGAFSEDEDELGANTMNNPGSAYIFHNSAGVWSETQKLVSSDRSAADCFGFDVDINGIYIIVGAYYEDDDETGSGAYIENAGSAYIFEYNGGIWNELKKIISLDRASGDFFGYSVAINNTYAVVGAYDEDENETGIATLSGAGSAYVFVNSSPSHFPIQKIVASDRNVDDKFGYDVAINGDYIIIGAYFEAEDEQGLNPVNLAGSAYIYHYKESVWTQKQKIVAQDRNPTDYFGSAVGISGNYIIVGAQLEDEDADGINNRPQAGSAYIFHNCREINAYQETTQIDNGGNFDFGHVVFGNNSSELTFTIENTGVDNLILDGTPIIEISGTNATDFTIDQTATSSPVVPDGSTTFTIIFTPSSANLHTAEISISNNDYDENPYNFTITGTGDKIPQTISGFNTIATKTYGDDDFIVSANASSGLDVIFTSADNNIAICGGTNGSNITIIGAGSCEIYANQPGNDIYLAAPQLSQTLTVNEKPITITADAGQTKEYGDTDPILNYTVTIGSLETGDNFSGALSRVVGESVAIYEILIGTLSAGSNYDISFITNDFAITERTIYVTANADQSKIYGQFDPVLTYSFVPNLIGEDVFTGSISRVTGEDAGFYEIQQGTLSLNSNYILNYTSDNFEIIAKTITVTPTSNQSKIYGTTDPSVFTYNTSPALELGDTFTGGLSREAGENAGFYAILTGTLDAGDNYIMSVADVNFEIIAKPITVTAYSDQSKTYGDNDPIFTYYSTPSPQTGDEFTGELSRAAGEDLGFYTITQGSLNLGSNYNLSFNTADFEIKIKGLWIIVDQNQTKEYGDADPEFTFTTSSPIAAWDDFSGALSREAGESVGDDYEINQGTLALSSNYYTYFLGADFEITQKTITVTADANQTKYYGEANPDEYTYTYTGTLASGDIFSGALSRQSGEDVGTYNILQASLWISPNYQIIYNGDIFEILQGEINVTANTGQTKTYGNANPTQYTYQYTGTLAISDNFTGSLIRVPGEDVGNYEIQQGSLSLSNNYNITYNPNNFEITPKPITITADAGQSKVFGDNDPAEYFYTVSESLIGDDSFTGELVRETGENVGLYEILQGNLSLNNNYTITYNSDNFEITKATPIITWANPADIYYGTALSSNQLNALANVTGSFIYNPDFSTILEVGDNQTLNTEFTPDDNVNYNNAIASVYINVLLNIGIDKYKSNIKIYPNPATEFINIEQEGLFFEHIKVYDITGKIVIQQSLNNLITSLDIRHLPSGVYFIALKTINSPVVKRIKLVKTAN